MVLNFGCSATPIGFAVGMPGEVLDDADCQLPFPLTAKLNRLTIKVDRPKLLPGAIKKLKEIEKKAVTAVA